jgi:hypothetical protein
VGLDVITGLGYTDDSRLKPALEILRNKQLKSGRWKLEAVHPDIEPGAGYSLEPNIIPFKLEDIGRLSKWITLNALRILRRVDDVSA